MMREEARKILWQLSTGLAIFSNEHGEVIKPELLSEWIRYINDLLLEKRNASVENI